MRTWLGRARWVTAVARGRGMRGGPNPPPSALLQTLEGQAELLGLVCDETPQIQFLRPGTGVRVDAVDGLRLRGRSRGALRLSARMPAMSR